MWFPSLAPHCAIFLWTRPDSNRLYLVLARWSCLIPPWLFRGCLPGPYFVLPPLPLTAANVAQHCRASRRNHHHVKHPVVLAGPNNRPEGLIPRQHVPTGVDLTDFRVHPVDLNHRVVHAEKYTARLPLRQHPYSLLLLPLRIELRFCLYERLGLPLTYKSILQCQACQNRTDDTSIRNSDVTITTMPVRRHLTVSENPMTLFLFHISQG